MITLKNHDARPNLTVEDQRDRCDGHNPADQDHLKSAVVEFALFADVHESP
jgi:hypothetical protein